MRQLKEGAELSIVGGGQVRVESPIGEGGQGAVYKAVYKGGPCALKLYHTPTSDETKAHLRRQREALKALCSSPSPSSAFLWPKALVDAPDLETCGYIMPLAGDGYQQLSRLFTGYMKPVPSAWLLCTAGLSLVQAFRHLHIGGSCFKDINDGGIFLNPQLGDVQVADCDNVRPDRVTPEIIYFPEFAAPEVLRRVNPCEIYTDQHSLAVLLFFMICRGHPLEGELETKVALFADKAAVKFYGEQPLFIFDPKNASNRPVRGFHDGPLRNWPWLPRVLKVAFTRAFTEGLQSQRARLTTTQWMDALSDARDLLFPCPHCGKEIFLQLDGNNQPVAQRCARCGAALGRLPPRLHIGDRVVVLAPGPRLFLRHLGQLLELSRAVGEVQLKDTSQGPVLLLRNRSKDAWQVTTRSGRAALPPKAGAVIENGMVLTMGGVEGRVFA